MTGRSRRSRLAPGERRRPSSPRPGTRGRGSECNLCAPRRYRRSRVGLRDRTRRMAPRSLPAISGSDPRHLGAARACRCGERRRARRDRRGETARSRLAHGKPARFSAAADRPVLCLRLASSRRGAGRSDRRRARCGDRLRHRRASLDPRLSAGLAGTGAKATDSPPAGYRRRDRNPVDRRGQATAAQGIGRRYRSGLGRGRPPQYCTQLRRRPGAGRPLPGIPRPRHTSAAL